MFGPEFIKLSTTIHTRPEVVFQIMADFPRYPEWNPWSYRITRPPADGKGDFIATHPLFGRSRHHLTAVTAPERLCWNLAGWHRLLVQAQREMLVYPTAGQDSLVTLKITLTGPAVPLLRLGLKGRIRRQIAAELKALKERAEAQLHQPDPGL